MNNSKFSFETIQKNLQSSARTTKTEVTDRIIDESKIDANTIDGWLLYDFRGSNSIAMPLLKIPESAFLSRRFYYWVPLQGTPIKIVHFIEAEAVKHIPGTTFLYSSWKELEAILETTLANAKQIAMEYSPYNSIPTLSKVDAGTVEWLKKRKIQVVSSWPLLEPFIAKFDSEQIEMYRQTSAILLSAFDEAWKKIELSLTTGKNLTELDIQESILQHFLKNGCTTEHLPICAVGAHSALPHYFPTKASNQTIKKGDFVLIDAWCRLNNSKAPYADYTQVALCEAQPTAEMTHIYKVVYEAQDSAIRFLQERIKANEAVCGFEVDDVARKVTASHNVQDYFLHRTGHNIYIELHGPGANFDNFETHDTRLLTPNTCYSIEPGIYLPERFGCRLECNVLLLENGTIEVFSKAKNSLKVLKPL